jgi:hypothetical protein
MRSENLPQKQKLREFMTTKPALQKIFKVIPLREVKLSQENARKNIYQTRNRGKVNREK